MSIYSEKKPSSSRPFKTVTVEYYEEFETDDKKVTPNWQGQGKGAYELLQLKLNLLDQHTIQLL